MSQSQRFSTVTGHPPRYANEFHIVIQSPGQGSLDLPPLVHMFVGEGQIQHGMKRANWDDPEKSLDLQLRFLFSIICSGSGNHQTTSIGNY